METWKIARACAIGGALCAALALIVAPGKWWLAAMAGFAAGYLAYEFMAVLRAIPVAFDFAWHATARTSRYVVADIVGFFARPHPFGYFSFAVWIVIYAAFAFLVLMIPDNPVLLREDLVFGAPVAAFFIALLIGVLVWMFAVIGARFMENAHWDEIRPLFDSDERRTRRGLPLLRLLPLTFRNVMRWFFKGVLFSFVFVPYYVVRFVIELPFYTLYHLIRIIHLDKRVLCGVDGTLGGLTVASYFKYVGAMPTTSLEYVFCVACGALLGGAFGVVNWELVSKRIFGFGRT